MAINKNFVVKNGLEVSDSLIFADALEGRVGVGTTTPKDHLFHVFGGIGVTDAYVTGITTIAENLQVGPGGTVLNVLASPGIGNSVGIGNSTPEYLLDVRAPVSTGQTAFYVRGDARITGDLYIRDDLTIDELSARNIDVSSQTSINFLSVIGVSTFASNIDANHDLNVIGISTFESNVDINDDLDVDGRTELDTTNISETLNVVGISTFASNVDINAELDVENDAVFGGDIRIRDEGTTNIFLMNDGAATFSRDVQVGAGFVNGGGCNLFVSSSGSSDEHGAFVAKGLATMGSSAKQSAAFMVNDGIGTPAAIFYDGSATFAGGLLSIDVAGAINTSSGLAAQNKSGFGDSEVSIILGLNTAGTHTTKIFADGSATFAGRVVGSRLDVSNTTTNTNDVVFSLNTGSSIATVQRFKADGSMQIGNVNGNTDTANIELNADGSATFKAPSGSGVEVQTVGGNEGSKFPFVGKNTSGTTTFSVNGDGSAYFAGNFGIGASSPSKKLQLDYAESANHSSSNGSYEFLIWNKGSSSSYPTISAGIQLRAGDSNAGAGSIHGIRKGPANQGELAFATTDAAGSNVERMRIDSAGRLLVGTPTSLGLGVVNMPDTCLYRQTNATSTGQNVGNLKFGDTRPGFYAEIKAQTDATPGSNNFPGRLVFQTTASGASSPTEKMIITSSGRVYANATVNSGFIAGNTDYFSVTSSTSTGNYIRGGNEPAVFVRSSGTPLFVGRQSSDGVLVGFYQDGIHEGSIVVSGGAVSLAGGHLSRYSQLPGGVERTEILRGSVLSNIDEMCEWGDEDNEQLNRMKVSDVEGDKNVSGVFQAWDDDDDTYTNDFYCAMTGDFVIRIAQGTTVTRGDLLMSAGDGTAKPQDDDIVRSKTIAKVTSTTVSATYSDGSYCVPCVLMAC